MRVLIFLGLLLEVWAVRANSWESLSPGSTVDNSTCLSGSCGCCLMQKQMGRMKQTFDSMVDGMTKYLNASKMVLDFSRARSAFSVSLSNGSSSCSAPATANAVVRYDKVMLNMGGGYNTGTGVFTVAIAGVYSVTVTIHASASSGTNVKSCVSLRVNGRVVTDSLSETQGDDPQDSSTVVVTLKLQQWDEVSVMLLAGCVICNKDQGKHFNTFTGILLYPTRSVSG